MVSNFKQITHSVAGIELVIHDLVDGNSSYIEDYLKIYQELFPQYLRYLPVMQRRSEIWQIILLLKNGISGC